MPSISYETRQKIVAQALEEIQFAREYKQGKTRNWRLNEIMYYAQKNYIDPKTSTGIIPTVTNPSARANVELGKMAGFLHTLLSKIDEPLLFKFTKRKISQLKRVTQLNALRVRDQDIDDWDIKDIAGKKQAAMYGRAVFSYFADSVDEYKPHLDNVDVYDFLIDPSAGGLDVERAMYIGDYGVVKSRDQLKQGIKDKIYLKTETDNLLSGDGNSTDVNVEEQNKTTRTRATNVTTTQKEIGSPDKFKFWRWGTTFEGKRYFLLLSETGGTAVEITPLEEKFASGLWWYWTYAAFIDLTEFWTPGYCDYVREVFMAQAVSINQSIDNSEQINKPQKLVNVGAVENLLELKYRREGYIKVKKEYRVQDAVQIVTTPSIDTPLKVYDKLEAIQEKASGITAGSQGAAAGGADEKVAIYEGNQAEAGDRYGLLNKSYAFGYKRFSRLWLKGVDEHLVKKIAVDILGPDGVEVQMISRRDIFRKNEEFNVKVESSKAEIALSDKDQKTKLAFLQSQAVIVSPNGEPLQNPKKAYELMASIAGFDDVTVRELMDTSDFGDAGIMSEAERDIERILDGEKFLPNQAANTAYKQRFVDYMTDNQENINMEQFTNLANYLLLLDPVIERNMVRQANNIIFREKMKAIMTPAPTPIAPKVPTRPPNGGGVGI